MVQDAHIKEKDEQKYPNQGLHEVCALYYTFFDMRMSCYTERITDAINFIQKYTEILIMTHDCAPSVILPVFKIKKRTTFCGPIIFTHPLI